MHHGHHGLGGELRVHWAVPSGPVCPVRKDFSGPVPRAPPTDQRCVLRQTHSRFDEYRSWTEEKVLRWRIRGGLRRAAPGCAGLRRAFPPGEGRAGRHTERREGRARVGSMETQPRMMNDECNATYETAAGSQAADVRRTAGAGAWQSGRCARPASGPGLRRAAAARARAAPPAAS